MWNPLYAPFGDQRFSSSFSCHDWTNTLHTLRKLCSSIRMEIVGPEFLPAVFFFVYLLYESGPQLTWKNGEKKTRTIAPQQQPEIGHSRNRENEKTNIRNSDGGDLHFAAK